MKKEKTMKNPALRLFSALLALLMIFSAADIAAYAETSDSGQTTSATGEKQVKKGWQVNKNGKRSYYVKGKPVKNKVKKIKNYRYYFNKKGHVVEGKTVKFNKKTYYLSNKGHVRAFKKKGKYYFPDSTKMTKAQSEDWKARLNAEKIAEEITNDSMTKKEKLRKCFDWVMAKPYITYRKFSPTAYWPATYANDHFTRAGGDCHADAAAFAYLAAAIGYKNVYVCNDATGTRDQGHAWTEINGKVYDPLFAQAKSFSKNYGVSYGTYILRPILHINMDYNDERPKK